MVGNGRTQGRPPHAMFLVHVWCAETSLRQQGCTGMRNNGEWNTERGHTQQGDTVTSLCFLFVSIIELRCHSPWDMWDGREEWACSCTLHTQGLPFPFPFPLSQQNDDRKYGGDGVGSRNRNRNRAVAGI